MPYAVRLCLVCYRATLWLYPADLRRYYGAEMTDAFAQMLAAESAAHGARGIASSGYRAIAELLTVAVPRHMTGEWMMTAILLVGMNLGYLLLENLFLHRVL